MNTLSWLLYLTDVISNLSNVFKIAAIGCIIFCATCIIGQLFTEGELSKDCPSVWRYWWRCAIAAVILGSLASLSPSRNTMYAIAASEVGETVVKSETVQGIAGDATKALQQWIKNQIDPPKQKD